MAFVNRQGGARQQEIREAAGAEIDFDPLDEAVIKVHYDLSAWNFEQHADLAEALAEAAVPHVWDGTELVVPEAVEERVDALFERLEAEHGPFPVGLDPDAEAVEYGLDEWSAADRRALTDAMVDAEIPHRWSATTLLVAADAEESVDDLLDAIESGTLMSADAAGGSYARDGVLGELFLATNKLGKDPYDAGSRSALIALRAESDPAQPPYAFAPATWSRIVGDVDALVTMFQAEADGEDVDDGDDGDSVIAGQAKQLSALLRQFV